MWLPIPMETLWGCGTCSNFDCLLILVAQLEMRGERIELWTSNWSLSLKCCSHQEELGLLLDLLFKIIGVCYCACPVWCTDKHNYIGWYRRNIECTQALEQNSCRSEVLYVNWEKGVGSVCGFCTNQLGSNNWLMVPYLLWTYISVDIFM